jgi:VIT family
MASEARGNAILVLRWLILSLFEIAVERPFGTSPICIAREGRKRSAVAPKRCNPSYQTAGLAEIAAGSIAMGLDGYLAARSDAEHYASERLREQQEIKMQVSAGRVFAHNTTACSGLHHCLLVFKQRMKHSQRDGFLRGAGDGTRTRDSLLGRQGVTVSALVCHELALLARAYHTFKM